MSWLSHAIHGIRFDKHTLGNLMKNVSPALAFTPLGPLGAAGLSALGDLGRGKNLKQAAIGGVENAAIGSGLHAGAGLLSSAIHGGAGAAGSVGSAAGSVASDAAPATTSIGGVILPAPAAAALPAAFRRLIVERLALRVELHVPLMREIAERGPELAGAERAGTRRLTRRVPE